MEKDAETVMALQKVRMWLVEAPLVESVLEIALMVKNVARQHRVAEHEIVNGLSSFMAALRREGF